MPFPLIPTALGVGFLLVWVLIGSLMFRDGQLAVRRQRDAESHTVPLPPHYAARARLVRIQTPKQDHKKSRMRAAS